MWDEVNAKESWWERKTGREYGFENHAARVRRMARKAGIDTSTVSVPPAGRGRGLPSPDSHKQLQLLEREERAARQKAIKQLQPLQKRLRRKLAAAEASAKQIAKTKDRSATRRAQQEVAKLEREVAEITAQLKKYGA